ncbi:MAG: hypothetical protein WB762_21280 [Candidatus Sulfotelmatobacter sp.]
MNTFETDLMVESLRKILGVENGKKRPQEKGEAGEAISLNLCDLAIFDLKAPGPCRLG